jgi:hypothetical protein
VRRRGEVRLWRAPGRHHARPVAHGRLWARLGTRLLVNADVVLVKGMHGQLQEGQGESVDMVRGDGCERRGGEHVGVNGGRHGLGFGHGDQERGVQWPVLVMGGVRELQGLRDGRGWTWSKVKLRYGHKVYSCLPGV